mmetsp:Transcript_29505/g.75057  ORF Transcript_29505/g.75057 Transcript_29505/m.75057 type:complete len:231 (-) Transcript_29505:19-711(-)
MLLSDFRRTTGAPTSTAVTGFSRSWSTIFMSKGSHSHASAPSSPSTTVKGSLAETTNSLCSGRWARSAPGAKKPGCPTEIFSLRASISFFRKFLVSWTSLRLSAFSVRLRPWAAAVGASRGHNGGEWDLGDPQLAGDRSSHREPCRTSCRLARRRVPELRSLPASWREADPPCRASSPPQMWSADAEVGSGPETDAAIRPWPGELPSPGSGPELDRPASRSGESGDPSGW